MCGNWDTNAVVGHWSVTGKWLNMLLVLNAYLDYMSHHHATKISYLQYLKYWRPVREMPIFERFPVLVCVAIIWIYSIILTASGAYRDRPTRTQFSCRTDKANLISTAPWFVI